MPVAHSVHTIHRAYIFRRTLFVAILPVSGLLLLLGWASWDNFLLLLLIWIPYVLLNAFVFYKNFRLFVAPDALQVNSGVWGRQSKVLKWYKIQQVMVQQSIYQRHRGLATLTLVTAGGNVSVPYITLELAHNIRNYALYEIERSGRHWM
jgi:putative membrane protein